MKEIVQQLDFSSQTVYTLPQMSKISFFGAAGEVTGSCFLLTASDGTQCLIDFGMFQGSDEQVKQNYGMLDFDAQHLKAVFLTHAHLDHSGRLPLLIYGGFKGRVYMTEPTRALVEVILTDSARIAEKDMTKEPLYTMEEVDKILQMIQIVQYDQVLSVGPFKITFRDAGHILGSSSIEITDTSADTPKKFVFSGDLGNTPQDIMNPTKYIDSADIVVMESTYGDKNHPDEDIIKIIQEEINAVEEDGGVLMIPAFSIERTQELLHRIHHMKEEGKVGADVPVFLDSPMGSHVTQIYREYTKFCNDEIHAHTKDPFTFDGLRITDESYESKKIVGIPGPKVIIAGSGMMSGGRIMHHAENYLPYPNTRILFVGYQAEETMGRDILEGVKNVTINNETVQVKAKIREIETLSSHADQQKLLTWLGHIKGVKKVFLVHGEPEQREILKGKIQEELGIKDVILPDKSSEHEA
jgi:metallo-beta-lactamase family protein